MNRQETQDLMMLKLQLRQIQTHHANLKEKYAKLVQDYRRLNARLSIKSDQRPKVNSNIENVKQAILDVFGVDVDTKTRHKPVVTGRTAYCSYLRHNTSLALVDIARTLMTLPHHATIIHSINQHADWYTYDKSYKNMYDQFEKRLTEINETKKMQNL